MSQRQSILQQLARSKNMAVERIADHVLPDCPAADQRELAAVLLERNHRAGWVALIRCFDRLDESVRGLVVARPRDLFGPLADSMQDSRGAARQNVISIIRQCADAKLTFLLAEALIDARPGVRDLAGQSLMESVRLFLSKPPTDETAAEDAAQLNQAIEHALRQFKTHRQASAVAAAIALERQPDGRTWAYFGDTYDELTRAGTLMLRSAQDPAIARGLVVALTSPLKPAAMAGLSAAELPAVVSAIIANAFRLLDPLLREVASAIGHAKLFAAAKKHALIHAGNWQNWIRLIDALGVPGSQKALLLQELLQQAPVTADGLAWKLAIAEAAARTRAVEAGEILTRLADDPDERVARIAARFIVGRRLQNAALASGKAGDYRIFAAGLAASSHASVRRIAEQVGRPLPRSALALSAAAAPADASAPAGSESKFDRVWSQYAKLPPAVQQAQARAAAADPAFVESLKARLASSLVAEVAQGIKMLSTLHNVAPFRSQIISLCGHSDPRVVAIAVRLAGRLEDARLKDLLELAAHHNDARVRANAVESMEDLRIADRSQQVLTMLNSRHNRERANAIKAISRFNFETARECLLKMLADPNPLHRISALWVVEQLQILELVRQVSSVARRDPNVRVRKRASALADTLASNVTTGA